MHSQTHTYSFFFTPSNNANNGYIFVGARRVLTTNVRSVRAASNTQHKILQITSCDTTMNIAQILRIVLHTYVSQKCVYRLFRLAGRILHGSMAMLVCVCLAFDCISECHTIQCNATPTQTCVEEMVIMDGSLTVNCSPSPFPLNQMRVRSSVTEYVGFY